MSSALLESEAIDPALRPFSDDDGELYEVVDGRRVENAPMGAPEAILATWLVVRMANFADAHDLGQAVGEALFDLRPAVNRNRRPDAAFVSYGRWAKGRRLGEVEAWPVVPDLVVEVVSPSNLASDLMIKVREYFRAGVRLVWLIYPALDEVHAYQAPGESRLFGRGDVLVAEPVLPGFRLDVSELFGPPIGAGQI